MKVYMPRRMCMFYEGPVIWLHVVSDLLIALAYYSIPFALVYFVQKRRDVAFGSVFWMFAAFILACGATHFFGVIDIWRPYYRVDGMVKAITAALSIATALMLWRLMPRLLAIPSASMLEATVRLRTAELENANAELRAATAENARLLQAERQARGAAERASYLKDEFLATLSHELRTPLNAILGWSQLLRRSSRLDPELEEGVAVIERNARAQTQLISELLDMSRILSGKLRLEVQRLDLPVVVDAALASVTPAADAKGIKLTRLLKVNPGPIAGDAARLQQVLWNILTNAIKFTAAGGNVQVSVDHVEGHAEIAVTDSGDGIPADFLPFVFERFRQLDGSTTRRHGGLGIGLSIVRSIVEAHGGIVAAASPGIGKGATFTIKLPLSITAAGASAGDGSVLRHSGEGNSVQGLITDDHILSGVKVLVVDDEPDAIGLAQRTLRDRQALVLSATSAADGLELLKRERPHVLISDIGMPDEDGYQFIKKVRALSVEEGGSTPAAAFTAFAGAEDRRRALTAGFQFHIAKPVEPATLVTIVAQLAGRTAAPQT